MHDRIVGNSAADPGGAIVNYANITALVDDRFGGNTSARYGGAIENFGNISLATGDSFTGNSASVGAGAVDNSGTISSIDNSSFTANTSGFAGALDNFGTIGDLSGDTFWRNSVFGYGGALANVFGSISTLTNDTFIANTVSDGYGQGGAIEQDEGVIGLLANDTIIGNHATVGGGIDNQANSTINALTGTIVASNTGKQGPNCENFNSTIVDAGYNLESDAAATCGFSAARHDLVGTNPALRPLGNFGGLTLTSPPLPTSPVIHAGPAGSCPTSTDQRGVPRLQPAGACQIGAVEWAPPVPVSLNPSAGSRSGGTHVRITGSGFTLATSVRFGSTPLRFRVVNDSTIDVVSPPGRGVEPVRVTNPDGTALDGVGFSYT
jgi:hypothetical protein